jgi:protein SCO1/2
MSEATLKQALLCLALSTGLFGHSIALATGSSAAPVNSAHMEVAPISGTFSLQSTSGKSVTNKTFLGKAQLIFFGFTTCSDVCSTVMSDVAKAMSDLGRDAAKVQPIFITIDPEHDTAKQLKEYLASFDDRIVGLRGNAAQTQAAVKAFRVYSKVRKTGADDMAYSMDHSAVIYLLKPDGSFGKILSGNSPVHPLVDDIKSVIQ